MKTILPAIKTDTRSQIADEHESRVRAAIAQVLTDMRSRVRALALLSALRRGTVFEVLRLLGLGTEDMPALQAEWRPLTRALRDVYEQGAFAAQSRLPASARLSTSFDLLNPRNVEFVRAYEFDLIRGITRNTREGIRDLIAAGFETGRTPQQTARDIKQLIGLLPRQITAVQNHRAMLIAEGVKGARLEAMVQRYTEKQLKFRASMIARTEVIRAANKGQVAAWRDARDNGLIQRDVKKIWVVTPDDRLCPVCAPIPSMNPGGVPLDGTFNTPVGPREEPPAHPMCRCAVSSRFGRN